MSSGAMHSLSYSLETVPGTTNSTPVFTPLLSGRTTLALTRSNFVSSDNRSDRQIPDVVIGAKKVAGDIPIDFRYGAFDPILEALLGGTWAAASKAATTISAAAVDNSYNDSASGFLAAGLQVGDIVAVTGFTTAANNIAAATITALTAGKMTIGGAEGNAIEDEAAGDAVTISTTTKSQILKAGVIRRAFTIERYFADLDSAKYPYHRFTGCEFSKASWKINVDAMITATLGVVGRDMDLDTAIISGETYAAAATNTPLDSFTGTIEEGGAVVGAVTEINLDLDNKIEPFLTIFSDVTTTPSIGRSDVKGSATFAFEDGAQLLKFVNRTESNIKLSMIDSSLNKITLRLPRIKYTGGQADVSNEGPNMLVMPFQAILDPVTNSNIIFGRYPVA